MRMEDKTPSERSKAVKKRYVRIVVGQPLYRQLTETTESAHTVETSLGSSRSPLDHLAAAIHRFLVKVRIHKYEPAFMQSRLLIVCSMLILTLFFGACTENSGGDIKATTFKMLDDIREAKKKEVLTKLNKLMDKSNRAAQDNVLMKVFLNLRKNIGKRSISDVVPPKYEFDIDNVYVKKYYDFYDILFVDVSGHIFSSVRRESDYGDNIFSGRIANTKLSKTLRTEPDIKFVDYDYYPPSKEAAAFFVRRVKENGQNLGWVIFQFSINAINSVLADSGDLGDTGEVYLANDQKVMLTDSRFFPHVNRPNRRIETTALMRALKGKSGNEIIEDYRGVRVFSSFEKFDFAGTCWIIVAEIDEDEVITRHFKDNEDYYIREIFGRLSEGGEIAPREEWLINPTIKVDINEYTKAEKNEFIATYGVTTCTGVLISYPKKFVYLGHLYPLDSTYYSKVEKTFIDLVYGLIESPFGDKVIDLLGEMIRDLKYYDVYPHEMRQLRAVLVAVHTNSFKNIVKRLLDSGMFLSQIKIMYDSRMSNAHICAGIDEDYTAVQWVKNGGDVSRWTGVDKVADLGELVKSIAAYGLEEPTARARF